MQQTVEDTDRDPDRTLRLKLQQRGLADRIGSWIQKTDEGINYDKWWWRALMSFLRLLTVVTFTVAVTGRVPLLSGRYRWFLRQRYLAPELSGTFVRFASRLTEGEYQKEDQESLSLLLVNAFLEDLRSAYRLRPWQVWRRRETAYPALLLDNLSESSGGFTLLRLINDARNQTGLFDPLLVISAGEWVPPDAGRRYAHRPHHDAAHALDGY
ncbi:hypothetical protein ACW9HQ_44820, partial [Nocardia gipuzkoensis]